MPQRLADFDIQTSDVQALKELDDLRHLYAHNYAGEADEEYFSRSARRFPIRREIQKLQEALDAFNERIAELESEGHQGRAMEVLRTNAMDFARQIDELRSLLR